jgi:hypothetical protein
LVVSLRASGGLGEDVRFSLLEVRREGQRWHC